MEDPEPQTPRGIDEGPPSPGRYIREQRLRHGMTLEEVSAKTKIPRSSLEALEEERWSALPGPVFVKGFLRCCARALEIDDQVVLDLLYEQERAKMHAEREPEPKPEPEGERRSKRGRGFGRGLLGGRLGRRAERSKSRDAGPREEEEDGLEEERAYGRGYEDRDGEHEERGYGRQLDAPDADRGYGSDYGSRGVRDELDERDERDQRDEREDPRRDDERGFGGAGAERFGGGFDARDERDTRDGEGGEERFDRSYGAREQDDERGFDRGYGRDFDREGDRGGERGSDREALSDGEREPWRGTESGRGGDHFGFDRGSERPERGRDDRDGGLDRFAGEPDRFGRGSERRFNRFDGEAEDETDREIDREPRREPAWESDRGSGRQAERFGGADRFGDRDENEDDEEARGGRGRRRSRRFGADRDEEDDERWDERGREPHSAIRAGPRVPSRRSLGRRSKLGSGEEREPRAPSELFRDLFEGLGRIAARLPGANIFLWVAVALLVLGLAFAVLMAFGAQQAVPPQS